LPHLATVPTVPCWLRGYLYFAFLPDDATGAILAGGVAVVGFFASGADVGYLDVVQLRFFGFCHLALPPPLLRAFLRALPLVLIVSVLTAQTNVPFLCCGDVVLDVDACFTVPELLRLVFFNCQDEVVSGHRCGFQLHNSFPHTGQVALPLVLIGLPPISSPLL